MDSFIGAAYFGYSLRQTGWSLARLQCFHDGHNVQSSKFEGRNQPQNIITLWLCFFSQIKSMRRYRVKRTVICFSVGAPESGAARVREPWTKTTSLQAEKVDFCHCQPAVFGASKSSKFLGVHSDSLKTSRKSLNYQQPAVHRLTQCHTNQGGGWLNFNHLIPGQKWFQFPIREQPTEGMAIPFTAKVSFFRAVITSPGHYSEPGLMKKKNSTPTLHDATFRQFLTQPDIARDFMEIHLPAELRAVCDLSTLKLESGSFVEDDLRQYFSDVLYILKTTAGDGYIHVLVEHRSTPDKHMAFRLIRYAVAAMQRHLEAGHKKLPLVIPMLFYTGKRSPYPYSTRWLDEFDDPALAGKLYSSAFPLVDVTVIPDDEIAGHRSMAALTLLQKHIHQRDLAELVDRLAPILLAGYLSSSQVISLVHYI